jgi:23S rRNA pseudouridine1911/1915/1917 synthase
MSLHAVSATTQGRRLDQFLQGEWPGHSRAFLQKLIEQGHVLVNGKPHKASYTVRAGDQVSVEVPPPRPLAAKAEAIPLDVLFEDDDLIVLNKSPGIVVHPGAGNTEHTLVNALLHHCREKLSGIGGVQRPGIVHRLDKGTSGCLVVAKTDLAHQSLVAQFKSRATKKIYRALCQGKFEKTTGHIETVIGRSPHNRLKMSARVARGRTALTDYHVMKQFADFALVELAIHTGRTHQIRVHMAHIGHPVLGDTVYGGARARGEKFSVARPLLHAYKLGFTHPRTQQFMEFTAPVPEDMVTLCRN